MKTGPWSAKTHTLYLGVLFNSEGPTLSSSSCYQKQKESLRSIAQPWFMSGMLPLNNNNANTLEVFLLRDTLTAVLRSPSQDATSPEAEATIKSVPGFTSTDHTVAPILDTVESMESVDFG